MLRRNNKINILFVLDNIIPARFELNFGKYQILIFIALNSVCLFPLIGVSEFCFWVLACQHTPTYAGCSHAWHMHVHILFWLAKY